MLSLFCSNLQFVIVSGQDIEKKITKILCPAGILYGKHLKKEHGKKLNRMRMLLYTYTHPHQVYLSTLAGMTCCQQFQFSS